MRSAAICVTFIAAFLITFSHGDPITDCWNQWSRCSQSWGNGVLWLDCNSFCICKGYAQGGTCVEVPSICFLFKKPKQCRCNGTLGTPTGEDCGPAGN